MNRLLTILFFAAFAVAATTPMLSKVIGFGPASAHAGPYASDNDDSQNDNDNQGEEEQ